MALTRQIKVIATFVYFQKSRLFHLCHDLYITLAKGFLLQSLTLTFALLRNTVIMYLI